jgi:hypothetical protein
LPPKTLSALSWLTIAIDADSPFSQLSFPVWIAHLFKAAVSCLSFKPLTDRHGRLERSEYSNRWRAFSVQIAQKCMKDLKISQIAQKTTRSRLSIPGKSPGSSDSLSLKPI